MYNHSMFSPTGIEITRVTYCSFQTDVFCTVAPVRVNIVCSEHEACEGTDWKPMSKPFTRAFLYYGTGVCEWYRFQYLRVLFLYLPLRSCLSGHSDKWKRQWRTSDDCILYSNYRNCSFWVQARVSDSDLSTAFRNGIHLLQGRWTESGSVRCTYIQSWILVHQG